MILAYFSSDITMLFMQCVPLHLWTSVNFRETWYEYYATEGCFKCITL